MRIIGRLMFPVADFAHNKVAGAVVLIAATLIAIAWANSPWEDTYRALLGAEVQIGIAGYGLAKPVYIWVNDGLMAFFFFVVGLEIKREALAGELSSLRKAALPIAGAIGGMAVPALLYISFTAGTAASRGWGIPMATDIAFALGILMLAGPRVPLGLKVFLTALAIVDDIGAIAIIAIFYTDSISIGSLVVGAMLLLISITANRCGVRKAVVYFIIGTGVWLAFLASGVHATLASVLMAMTIPAKTRIDCANLATRVVSLLSVVGQPTRSRRTQLLTATQQQALQKIRQLISDASAPLQELEHTLLPLVTFFVLPVFALANAGVSFGADSVETFGNPICIGVAVGLLIGKPLGIVGSCLIAYKLNLAEMPQGVTWRGLLAVSVLGGIGFTMSLFVSSLAFFDPESQQAARVGILLASTLSAAIGAVLIARLR